MPIDAVQVVDALTGYLDLLKAATLGIVEGLTEFLQCLQPATCC